MQDAKGEKGRQMNKEENREEQRTRLQRNQIGLCQHLACF